MVFENVLLYYQAGIKLEINDIHNAVIQEGWKSRPDGEESRRDRRGGRGVLGGRNAVSSELFSATALVC